MKYEVHNYATYRVNDDGNREMLCNFVAEITKEVRYIDGRTTDTYVTLEGLMAGEKPDKPISLPAVTVPAATFVSMTWPMQAWGIQTILCPGSGIKDDLRAAIQLASPNAKVINIYRHLGWQHVDGKPMYLHAEGAIGKNGNKPDVQVQLPLELSRFDLTPDPEVKLKDAVASVLELVNLAPAPVSYVLLAATLAPILGPVDFAIHLSGRTGTYKSELISLYQSFFGPEMDARHLPGSWSSTGNAMEAQAFYAANAPLVIDDFVPQGTSYQVRQMQSTADKIVRAQGNQAGRARLTDTSQMQQTMYPRGIILSTGEDTPEGQSVRARMMILEMSPGDIDTGKLTTAQAKRALPVNMVAAYIAYVAEQGTDATFEQINKKTAELRTAVGNVGHSRTPSMVARLYATIEHWLDWLVAAKMIKPSTRLKMIADADKAIQLAANSQIMYLEAADPVEQFTAAIRQTVALGAGHFRTLNGGTPANAGILGWNEGDSRSDIPVYVSRGPCIGWVDWDADEMYIDTTAGLNVLKKQLGSDLAITRQTLLKRLKDAGMLLRTDEARQRNTTRITAEKHSRQVLVLSISGTLETDEKPNTEGDAHEE